MNRRRMEGHLSKFTNVVKGWQYRWFVLDPSSRVLKYYLPEDKCRGMEEMEGALVIPSEEDSQTFSIQFSTGEVYRLRATEAKERQVWVDQLRASSIRPSIRQERGSGGASNWRARSFRLPSSRSEQFINPSTDTSDPFASVEDILLDMDFKHQEVVKVIESLPLPQNATQQTQPSTPNCHSKNLLLLKATSEATLHCLEAAYTLLQDITLDLQVSQLETSPRLYPSPASVKIKNTGN
eukprot:GFUD01038957.1.p1 GENE.GFUD01038957.1~~GFUD01038957.1.p1  ORF type:complete len:238 (-),score=55.55 GFUD01038957.1:145-858(-)